MLTHHPQQKQNQILPMNNISPKTLIYCSSTFISSSIFFLFLCLHLVWPLSQARANFNWSKLAGRPQMAPRDPLFQNVGEDRRWSTSSLMRFHFLVWFSLKFLFCFDFSPKDLHWCCNWWCCFDFYWLRFFCGDLGKKQRGRGGEETSGKRKGKIHRRSGVEKKRRENK